MEYQIKANPGWTTNGRNWPLEVVSEQVHFEVIPSGARTFVVTVTIPLDKVKIIQSNKERTRIAFSVEAIRQLKSYLNSEPEVGTTIEMPTDPAETGEFRTTKYCKFFERTPKGPICKVWGNEDKLKGATSLHVCENSCNLPDTELLCSHVVHPETMSFSSRKNPIGSPAFGDRGVVKAHCDLGKKDIGQYSAVADVKDCQLGKRDCWELLYIPQAPSQEMSLDTLVDRVLAELRTVNMIFREQLKLEPFKPPDFATGREFLRECSHPEDLSNNLNTLTDIFAHMDFKQFLSQVPPGTKSIKHLSLFLEERFAGREENIVQTFRDIRTLALYYPRHAKLDEPVLEAHRRLLRLTPPISDYGNAWRTILQNFFQALRELKNLLLD